MASIADKIAAATLADATAWRADNEKFLFCIDRLEISAHSRIADWAVNNLENRFEELLAKQAREEDTSTADYLAYEFHHKY